MRYREEENASDEESASSLAVNHDYSAAPKEGEVS
jgi:hypothetical protein